MRSVLGCKARGTHNDRRNKMSEGLRLVCSECDRVWTVCQLPIDVNELVKATKNACCPECGDKKPLIYTGGKK
jgi:hypothetical protein